MTFECEASIQEEVSQNGFIYVELDEFLGFVFKMVILSEENKIRPTVEVHNRTGKGR